MEDIELSLDTPDGTADCRFEPDAERKDLYHLTILYPNIINGYSRSEIFCYDLVWDQGLKSFVFCDDEAGLHPKIRKMEKQLSDALLTRKI
ncbi:MAG: hypothetical protein EOP49_01940 [Sphingobacteriales bacterium]|nr:MAG: hypothetical protein EOP49_01940 [Sphingobacteriales bacterium]